MDLRIQGWIWCSKVTIWASNLWTLLSGTSIADGGVEWEKVGNLLVPGADPTGAVSVGLDVG